MANNIEINLKPAKDEVQSLINLTTKAKQEFLEAAQAAMSINNIRVSTPGQLSTATGNNAAQTAAVRAYADAVTQSQAKVQAAYEKTRLAEIRLAQQREKAVDNFNKNEIKAQAALAKSTNQYNIIQQEVNQLTATYNNLAIKRELGLKLNTKEEAQLSAIIPRLNQYNNALKKVDADIGKYGRNVGNYESGTRNLTASIGQISRELPNFGQSFSIGILSLTNNIGALQDGIKQTIAQNQILKAEGKATTSVLGAIGGAVFSWTTALYIGIGVFSAYSKEIGEFVFGTESAKKAQEELTKATEEKIEAEKRSNQEIANSIASETSRAKILFEVGRNEKNNIDQRNKAFDDLKSRYGTYLGDLTRQEFLSGKTADAEERLNTALINRGYALGAQSLLQKNAEAQLEAQVELQKVLTKNFDLAQKAQKNTGSESYFQTLRKINSENQKAQKIAEEKLNPLKEEQRVLLALFNSNSKYLNAVNENTQSSKQIKKTKEEEIGVTKNSINAFNEQIEALKKVRDNTDITSEGYEFLNDTIKLMEMTLKGLTEGFEAVQEQTEDGIVITDEQLYEEEYRIKRLQDATEEFLRGVSQGALSQLGFGSLKTFFDGTFNALLEGADTLGEKFAVTFNAITEVAQDAFNFISQASQANFEAETARLEKQRDYALKFAGDSVSGREAIEEQYEDKRRSIQKRQAEAQKRLSLFNIFINTAQGVTAALALGPVGIPLAVVIGALGAVQASIVASQQIPQFFRGGKHKGGLMMVNDAKGNSYKETIVTPDGKIIQPEGRNVIMDAPAGTQILTPEQVHAGALTKMLSDRGIGFNAEVVNKLEGRQAKFDDSRIVNAINKKVSFQIIEDAKGRRVYQVEQNKRTEILNSYFNVSG